MAAPALSTVRPRARPPARDPELATLTKGVASLVSGQLGSGNQYPISLAAALVMTIPVALVFIFFQRYFVRGGTAGAEKG